MEQEPKLNEHNKQEYPPMHTTEHILNRTMVNMFGCGRARVAHIERKKSKCDYHLPQCPTDEQVAELQRRVNEVIARNLPVTAELMTRAEAQTLVDLSRLPDEAGDTLRVVRVGDYDACACIGSHVENTSEIGEFRVISHDYRDGCWRVRFKLLPR